VYENAHVCILTQLCAFSIVSVAKSVCVCVCVCVCVYARVLVRVCVYVYVYSYVHCPSHLSQRVRGGGLGSRPKKMYGDRLGDGVEYHLMSPTPRR